MYGIYISPTHIECVSPAHFAEEVEFSISNNRVDFSVADVKYTYIRAAQIHSVQPRSGPISGGTNVTVQGSNFMESDSVFCRFGDKIVHAEYISASSVSCVSPLVLTPSHVSV